MEENWIADTQDGALMLQRYNHNNVRDEYGNVECPEVYFGAGVEYSDATGNRFGVDFEPKLRRMTLVVR